MRTVYRWWSWLIVAAIVLQIGFAGYGRVLRRREGRRAVPSTRTSSTTASGSTWASATHPVVLLILIGLIIAAVAGVRGRQLGRAGALFGLGILQILLAWIGSETPAVGFFHPINAFVILGLALDDRVDGGQGRPGAERPSRPCSRLLGPVAGVAADPKRRRQPLVGDVHRQALGRMAEVVAVVHPDARVVGPKGDDVALVRIDVQRVLRPSTTGCPSPARRRVRGRARGARADASGACCRCRCRSRRARGRPAAP